MSGLLDLGKYQLNAQEWVPAMTKKRCCLKYERKGKKCKGCPIIQLEDIFKDNFKKEKKKKKQKKKDKKKHKVD